MSTTMLIGHLIGFGMLLAVANPKLCGFTLAVALTAVFVVHGIWGIWT